MASYDIYFAGELKAGTDPAVVRARIRALFKLSDEAAAHLPESPKLRAGGLLHESAEDALEDEGIRVAPGRG